MKYLLALALVMGQADATPEQRVAALKQSLQDSQKRIRTYEWIETTIISLKGEEKSRKQQRVYYGADGKLQKLPVGDGAKPQPQPAASGGRGGRLKQRIVENKTEDMQEYMEEAAALIHQYAPPDPAVIQKVKDAGKMAIKPLEAGRVRLEFSDYLQAGDRLVMYINAAANTLAGLGVATYLDEPEDKVNLDVRFGALQDGTSFTAQTTLDATAKNIRVVVQNSGHRPLVK